MRKKILRIAFVGILVSFSAAKVAARGCSSPLTGGCTTPPNTFYSFGAAKAHTHTYAFTHDFTGFYCGRGLVNDPTNNGGNNFYGNTICVNRWPEGPTWFWYDWSADPDAGVKISVWTSGYPYQVVSLYVADFDCLLAQSAVDPYNP